ncbi:MAG: endonuclease/exonuclease/phosphatase family protein [Deltaproteobacteria bacterium]|jgi:hypothetical protein
MRPLVAALLLAAACGEAPLEAVVVSFNTGTTEGLAHDSGPDDGYSKEDATRSDTYYGDGLAWPPAIEAARAFLAEVQPDVVGIQEIFYSPDCATIPPEAHDPFVCTAWSVGDPTVANVILGAGYRVACHRGKLDKCVAVKKSFASIAGCDEDFCAEALAGEPSPGCGSGARVGLAELTVGDRRLDVWHVHGTSGFSDEDVGCRAAQFEQIFDAVDPATPTIVLGDLNTDPFRLFDGDDSAAVFRRRATAGDFTFHSSEGDPTYAGLFQIDHVLSTFGAGGCWSAGVTEGRPRVIEATYFDHHPLVCSIAER